MLAVTGVAAAGWARVFDPAYAVTADGTAWAWWLTLPTSLLLLPAWLWTLDLPMSHGAGFMVRGLVGSRCLSSAARGLSPHAVHRRGHSPADSVSRAALRGRVGARAVEGDDVVR